MGSSCFGNVLDIYYPYLSYNIFGSASDDYVHEGRRVAELASGVQHAGYYSRWWDALSVASGVYYARFIVSDEIGGVQYAKVNKLLLMK